MLHFLGHSTVRVELAGRTVLTDPLLARRIGALRRVVPLPDPAAWAGVDLVLISHLHGDHLHLPSLRQLGPDVRIVVPRGAGGWLRRRGFRHVAELSAGDTLDDGDLRITGVRAEHSGHRWGPRSTHGPNTDAIGHLIEGGGSTVYVSGDTALHDSMPLLGRAVRRRRAAARLGLGPDSRPRAPRPDRGGRGGRADPPADRRPGALGHADRRGHRPALAARRPDAPAAGRAAAAVRRRGGPPGPGDDGAS